MNWARARRVVRAVQGQLVVRRINVFRQSIADITSADFDAATASQWIICQESINDETEATGSTPAEIPLFSRVKAIKVQVTIAEASAACWVRWALFKSPDGDLTSQNVIDNWHVSDDNPTAREVRKNILAKGEFFIDPNRLSRTFRIFISRAAMARISPMREGDRINFAVAKDGQGTTLALTAWGNVWFQTA